MTEWMKVKGGNLNWIDGFLVEIILMMRGDFSLNGFLMILFYILNKWNRKLNDVYIKYFPSLFKDIIKEDYVGEFFN